MKVLFALGSEQTSKRVAEKYLEKYGDELEYKNVFYFKALLEEVKSNKSYDRIVISEDLEQFELKNIEALDKFIFNNVDNVTDEIEDSEIIFICSDRRSKDHDKFVERLFNIGIYNTLIGDERNISSLCDYIKNPMNKKEAKRHLNINPVVSDGTISTRDDEVEEAQIMSILNYYEGIKGNIDEYIPAFDRIAEQYSRNQLRVILNFLPADVKNEVLQCERYSYLGNAEDSQSPRNSSFSAIAFNRTEKRGLLSGILKDNRSKEVYTRAKNISTSNDDFDEQARAEAEAKLKAEEEAIKKAEEELRMKEEMNKKAEEAMQNQMNNISNYENTQNNVQEEFEKQQEELRRIAMQQVENKDYQASEQVQDSQTEFAKQQEELRRLAEQQAKEREEAERNNQMANDNNGVMNSEQQRLEEERKRIEKEKQALEEARRKLQEQSEKITNNQIRSGYSARSQQTSVKKVAALVGANKSGTTFIANAISYFLSSQNVNVGLLDVTKDNSLYYIYNQNDKTLRNIASECMRKLGEGEDTYIPVNKRLKVYTSVPSGADSRRAHKNKAIIDTVSKYNDVVIIDADFSTPYDYFERAQEIYIVQDMDIIRMQETTMFIRELKNRGIDMRKVKIIINKYVKCMLTPKKIVEGLSYYNDPQMSFVDDLLDSKVEFYMVPLNMENYARYIDCMYKNTIEYKKFTPDFLESISGIANSIYAIGDGRRGRRRGIFG